MRLVISKGNSKIGGVPNVSLPPGESCRKDVPCFNDGCYARTPMRLYPSVRKAWSGNLEYALADMTKYMDDISDYCALNKPKRFRWHVSGDILSQEYLDEVISIALDYPWIKFLCFTKMYHLDFSGKPKNLHIVLSTWPTLTLPKNHELPWAWIEKDIRIPADQHYFRCPGNCAECKHICWDKLDKNVHVVFPKH